MRVYVESDMTVCHVSNVISLKAGEVVDSPLADYLVESGCNVTIEDAPAPETAGVAPDGSGEMPEGEQQTGGAMQHGTDGHAADVTPADDPPPAE